MLPKLSQFWWKFWWRSWGHLRGREIAGGHTLETLHTETVAKPDRQALLDGFI